MKRMNEKQINAEPLSDEQQMSPRVHIELESANQKQARSNEVQERSENVKIIQENIAQPEEEKCLQHQIQSDSNRQSLPRVMEQPNQSLSKKSDVSHLPDLNGTVNESQKEKIFAESEPHSVTVPRL